MRIKSINLLLVVAAIFLAVSTSLAHAKLISSKPAAGETSAASPSSVTLEFSVRVQSRMSSIGVKDPSGGSVAVGPIVESDQGKLISVSLPQLVAGSYRVEWRALSADDHMIEGNFEFSVGDASQPVPVAPAALARASESRFFGTVRFEMLLAIAALLLAAILAFLPPAREHKPISTKVPSAGQEAR